MKLIPSLILASFLGTSVQASDYLSGRAEGLKAMQEGNFLQAAERFQQLALGTKNGWQIADALSYQATCLQKLGRTAEAMDLARKIEPRPASILSQMVLLKEGRQWKEVLTLSESEVFDEWPDKFIFDAYVLRGDAYRAMQDPGKAEADYASARRFTASPPQSARVALMLAELYTATDRAKALKAYAEVCELGPKSGLASRARFGRAKLFFELKEWERARAELTELEAKDPYWICTVQLLLGDIYEQEGKPKEALENYKKAAAVEKAPADLLGQAATKIAALEARG